MEPANFDAVDFGAAMTGLEALKELRLLWGDEFALFEEGLKGVSLPSESTDAASELCFDFDLDLGGSRSEQNKFWSVSFSSAFRKAISAVDKKLQGRVLEAISELTEKPDLVQGDTRKPLVGKLKGWWRYRIGDYRLVYEPNADFRIVICHDFAARGGVYE